VSVRQWPQTSDQRGHGLKIGARTPAPRRIRQGALLLVFGRS